MDLWFRQKVNSGYGVEPCLYLGFFRGPCVKVYQDSMSKSIFEGTRIVLLSSDGHIFEVQLNDFNLGFELIKERGVSPGITSDSQISEMQHSWVKNADNIKDNEDIHPEGMK